MSAAVDSLRPSASVFENRVEGTQHARQLRLTGALGGQCVHLVLPDDGVDQSGTFFR